MHIDTTRLNWTGPKIDPKTKKLQHLETKELCAAIAKGIPDGYELYTGFDEWCERLGVPYFVGMRAASGLKGSASTEHSTYPRSETRETTLSGEVKAANWSPESADCHGLRVTARVMNFAKSGKAIVGQFHGEKDVPMLKWQAKLIEPDEADYVEGKKLYRLHPQHRPFFNGVLKVNDKKEVKDPLGLIYEVGGAPFNYDFNVLRNWLLNLDADGDKRTAQYDPASYKKYDPTWYRKVGMYSQEDADEGSGYGDIRIYRLEMYETLDTPAPEGRDLMAELNAIKPGPGAQATLNEISNAIKSEPDKDKRYALNKRAQEVKAQL